MIKKEGKVYSEVAKRLQAMGIDTRELRIATFGRGPDHLIVIGDKVIGGYNHKSRRMTLDKDT